MIKIRPAYERGHASHGWLDSYHTFSFADYQDPGHMGFRKLRVINEDRVEPGEGFPTHSHRDMEIISYVLDGALEHKDSMGTGSVIKPGDVQRMSAGTGVTHSEYNPSKKDKVHFLQIWIFPESNGLKPSYEQTHIKAEDKKDKLCLIASSNSKNGAVKIHQDAELFVSCLGQDKRIEYLPKNNRFVWLQMARGAVNLNSVSLNAGDGAAISEEKHLQITAKTDSEILLFDLA